MARNDCRTPLQTAIVWCVLLSSHVHAAPQPTQDVLALRRQKIAQMSAVQRQDLERKYQAFKKLDESERARLQRLHSALERQGDLQQVMSRYVEWLKTLDITQREQLRQAGTPEQKRRLVQQFKQEQTSRKEEPLFEPRALANDQRLFSPLGSADLQTVMAKLEADLAKANMISPSRMSELQPLQGSRRYKLLMQSWGEQRHPMGQPALPLQIPDATVEKVLELIRNPEIREKLQARAPSELRQGQSRIILQGLMISTLEEARREWRGPQSDELRESVFLELTPELQGRYSLLVAAQRDSALLRHYSEEIWRAFAMAGDFPLGPFGERPGPIGRPFPGSGERMRREGDRARDGGGPLNLRRQRERMQGESVPPANP